MKNIYQLVKRGFSLEELKGMEISEFNFYLNELILELEAKVKAQEDS